MSSINTPRAGASERISSVKEAALSEVASKRVRPEAPPCNCEWSPKENGPYYVHLGCAATLTELRRTFEERCGVTGPALRIEKARYVSKEGKTPAGCPMAKYVVRRSGPAEKYMVICKKRHGHSCQVD